MTCCRDCDRILTPGDNAETRRGACLACIEQWGPTVYAPLTDEEQAWADAPAGTVVLTSADDVRHFEKGPNILDLPEAEARAIVGNAVYETLIAAKDDPHPRGTCTITAIGRESAGPRTPHPLPREEK